MIFSVPSVKFSVASVVKGKLDIAVSLAELPVPDKKYASHYVSDSVYQSEATTDLLLLVMIP